MQKAPFTSAVVRLGTVAGAVVSIAASGLGASAPAWASTANFGQQVSHCAHAMLPNDIGAGGSITMTMPDGTVMHFATFGHMVTFMRSHSMCS